MRTKEFIAKVEELGFFVSRTKHKTIVKNRFTHLVVNDEKKRYKVNFIDCDNKELFHLCVEYAWTPLR